MSARALTGQQPVGTAHTLGPLRRTPLLRPRRPLRDIPRRLSRVHHPCSPLGSTSFHHHRPCQDSNPITDMLGSLRSPLASATIRGLPPQCLTKQYLDRPCRDLNSITDKNKERGASKMHWLGSKASAQRTQWASALWSRGYTSAFYTRRLLQAVSLGADSCLGAASQLSTVVSGHLPR